MLLPMPMYENVNKGFDLRPNFKSFVTVNGSRYESSGAHKHKKEAEAQAAIEDLVAKHSYCECENYL
ncbi:hypothetical protein SUGI_1016370 [Cryptomeria japonica]|nr:hypothetical protein SUGI_1016370 [Cryptomeria japonica]